MKICDHQDTLEAVRGITGDPDIQQDEPLSVAISIVKLLKQTEDTPQRFPHGKWGTIHAMENKIIDEANRLEKLENQQEENKNAKDRTKI